MTSVVIVEYVMVSVCSMVIIQVFYFQNCIGKRVELDVVRLMFDLDDGRSKDACKEGSIPDRVCDNGNCGRPFHTNCLVEWLRSITTTRQLTAALPFLFVYTS